MGCQITIYNTIILTAENKQLQAANVKVQKKRAKKTVFVSKGGTLIAQEVLEGLNHSIIYKEARIQVVELPILSVLIHVPRTCIL